jgi:hypothetical protein
MPTYADVCQRMLACVDNLLYMLVWQDECIQHDFEATRLTRMLTYADVCRRMPTCWCGRTNGSSTNLRPPASAPLSQVHLLYVYSVLLYIHVLVLLYIYLRPPASAPLSQVHLLYVSSVLLHIYVLVLLYIYFRPPASAPLSQVCLLYVSSYYYIYVLVLGCTSTVASYFAYCHMCPHDTVHVSG